MCDKASDGEEALAIVLQQDVNRPYDIIFMDANMPNMVSFDEGNYKNKS